MTTAVSVASFNVSRFALIWNLATPAPTGPGSTMVVMVLVAHRPP
jgi:hypothetical protein